MKANGWMVLAGTLSLAALAGCQSGQRGVQSEMLASHQLPGLGGRELGVTVTRVMYGPGESARVHTHSCSVVGYVEYGKLRLQAGDEASAVHEAGETFYQPAGGVDLVAANESRDLPVQLVVWHACEGNAALALLPEVAR